MVQFTANRDTADKPLFPGLGVALLSSSSFRISALCYVCVRAWVICEVEDLSDQPFEYRHHLGSYRNALGRVLFAPQTLARMCLQQQVKDVVGFLCLLKMLCVHCSARINKCSCLVCC